MSRRVDRVYTRLHRIIMPPGRQQNAVDRFFVRLYTRFDVAFYKRFGLSIAARMMEVDVLLLRTVGRRTGRIREVLIACTRVDGDLVVGGGNWGWDRDPGWVHNIAASSDVVVVRGRETVPMRAEVLTGDAATRAQDALATAYPHSQAYVQRRTRPVPAVRLSLHG